MTILNRIKNQSLFTLSIYAAFYVVKTFVFWKIENPFKWLIDLPNYGWQERCAIIFGFMIYTLFFQMFLWHIDTED